MYETEFFAACPNNGARIKYALCIKAHSMIPAEAIISYVQSIESGYHEQIAEALRAAFGGLQTLRAEHHGVAITTHRSGPAKEFNLRAEKWPNCKAHGSAAPRAAVS